MLAPIGILPVPQLAVAQAPPAFRSSGEQHLPLTSLLGAVQLSGLQIPLAAAACPGGQQPPLIVLGGHAAGQQAPSLLNCDAWQVNGGGVGSHWPLFTLATAPG